MTEIETIASLLRQAIGLNPSSIGHDVIRRAVSSRMLVIQAAGISEYLAHLTSDADEIKCLIEAVVIPETSFFRDREPFSALVEYVRKLNALQPGKVIRILSIPSSTGEEPYSIAMALLESGVKKTDFTIKAHDISEPLLVMARQGIYTEYSFRGCDEYYKLKYFTKADNAYHLSESVKSCVEFTQANIHTDELIDREGQYDVVFCRNLLIYFDKEVKDIAIRKLSAALVKGGLLFVGHAETASVPPTEFARYGASRSFAYVKTSGKQEPAPTAGEPKASIAQRSLDMIRQLQEQRRIIAGQNHGPVTQAAPPTAGREPVRGEQTQPSLVERLEASFQRKDFRELSQQCAWIMENSPENTSHAFYYLGLICLRNADVDGARASFKKTIYLDPDYYPALLQLHQIEHGQGNGALAQRYYQRAERVMQRMTADKR
ncbi:MAG: CheR family methyltransferase [Pseudomonadota bacterium]